MGKEEIRSMRGNEISMIFQEPMTSLNPAFTVGNQIVEAIQGPPIESRSPRPRAGAGGARSCRHRGCPKALDDYPHALSGGMRQRAMIAMALACDPKLLIADEPTTALDVTIQAQVLDLLRRLQHELGMAILFVTHDLGVVAEIADRITVLYAGPDRRGRVRRRTVTNAHIIPIAKPSWRPCPRWRRGPTAHRDSRPGASPGEFPEGCRFHPRCSYAVDVCSRLSRSWGRNSRCVRDAELDT